MTRLIKFSLTMALFMVLQVYYYFHRSSSTKVPRLLHFPPQTMGKGRARKEEKEARESRLQQAIASDDVAEVHKLIAEEQELLDRVSKHPFPNTPLHLAAAAGKTQVAMEIAILRPSFAQKLNVDGYSPMHLALQHENYHTVRALMTIDTNLIRVRGRCGITPLHYVAEKEGDNELELLVKFLCACKSSIKDLTSRCETAVHVAVKKNNLKAFKVLFEWLEQVYLIEILDWKDEDGNTVLDIAESKAQIKIVMLLKECGIMKTKNLLNKAREISQVNPDGDEHLAEESQFSTYNISIDQYLRKERTLMDKWAFFFGNRNKSARDMILLVTALIASATYQAVLTPPGGYWQEDSPDPPANSTAVTANPSGTAIEKRHIAGKLIMSGSKLYQFMALNSAVFLASILTIGMTAMTLFPHTFVINVLTMFAGYAYFMILTTGFPNRDAVGARLLGSGYVILLTCVGLFPMTARLFHIIRRYRIYRRWRSVIGGIL